MSERKDKINKSMGEDTARKIWLAGIGAYGRAFSDAQESFTKLTKNSTEVFDELVQKGEDIETKVTDRSKDIANDVANKISASKVSSGYDLDDRISKLRNRFKYADRESTNEIQDRLDVIEGKLDQIFSLLNEQSSSTKKVTTKRVKPTKKTGK